MIDYFEEKLSLIYINKYMDDYSQVKIHFEYLDGNYQRHKKDTLKKIKIVSIQNKLSFIYNKISKKLGINEYKFFYLNELYFYNELLQLIDVHIGYQEKLLSILEEDKFCDVYKLSILANMEFCSNYKYLSNKINSEWIEFNKENRNSCRGPIYFKTNEFSDTRDSFDEFFNYKYKQLTSSNAYKKML